MKKLSFLLVTMALLMSSCYTINNQGRKPFFMVDAPVDLKVIANNEERELTSQIAISESMGNTKTYYYYPGFLLKFKRKNNIELHSNGKVTTVNIKGKPGVGMLIFESIFTLGIGTIIDIATNSFYFPKERFFDVPAYINGTKPRSHRELRRYIRSKNYSKVYSK